MKLPKGILAILFLFISITLFGQNILTITEKDRDGKYLTKDGDIEDGFINNKIVDINSVLAIDLNKNEIINKVGEKYIKGLPADLGTKLTELTLFMKNRNETLSKISETVDSYDYEEFKKPNSEDYKKYVSDLQKYSAMLVEILEKDDRIMNLYLTKYAKYGLYEGVYKAVAEVIRILEKEIEEFTKENGLYFQFGGWLIRKNAKIPIHFPGFDDIAPQEAFEVDRWQFLPTPKQLEELEDIKELAKENKDEGLNILKITAKNQMDAIRSFGQLKLDSLILKVNGEIATVKEATTLTPELLNLIKEIENLQPEINKFRTELNNRLEYYNSFLSINEFRLNDFLSQAKNDISFITNDGKKLLNKLNTIGDHINNLKEDVISTSGKIEPLFNKLKNEYTNSFKSLKSSAKGSFDKIVLGEELDIAALEFSEDVYKLALSDIPESTELDLVTTGVRSEGDRIVLKMIVAGKDNKKHMIDSREIYMFKVLTHIESTVGVIFADPFTPTNISTTFQMAPCYNLLFKGLTDQKARRRSIVYNRLFDWGFGLHVSAPDFNKDDVPEIGFGVVVSCLNDYLQSGVAYNVFEGVPYWFFGCRIPIPTFNSGVSVQDNSAVSIE